MSNAAVAIRVQDVTHHYGIRPVLRNVSLHVSRGELVALMGPNGVGKSTLLAMAAGLLSPLKGSVEIEGLRRRSDAATERQIRQRVAYLPAETWLPSTRTGREYLLAIGELYGVDADRLMDHIDRLLRLFHLESQADMPMRGYSTGQRRKIAIAGVLVSEAPVMLLDEPFSGGLDPSALMALRRVLEQLAKREDVTVLLATPVPELVEHFADRVAVMRDGAIVAYDTPDGLRHRFGRDGPLLEVLDAMMHPEGRTSIEAYFEGRS